MMINQKRLKDLLEYNPETGIFIWKVRTSKRVKIGDVAGCENSRGYVYIKVDNKNYRSHRLAWLYMTGEFPPDCIDHINGITNDNRWINLRSVTHSENMKNQKKLKNNISGHQGVSWDKPTEKWVARHTINNKLIHLGYFTNIEDAVAAREVVAHLYHENHGRQ
jgi:hypothetical protein